MAARRRIAPSMLAAVAAGLLLVGLTGLQVPARAASTAPADSWVPGLPAGVAEAALRPEPTLRAPGLASP